MHQRMEVLRAIEQADVPAAGRRTGSRPRSRRGADLGAVAQLIRDHPDDCWDDLVTMFRQDHYETVSAVADALFELDDPLIAYHMVRVADLSRPEERAAVRGFVERCDPVRHQVTLREIARTGDEELLTALRNRQELPELVQAELG
jgi:hypothetical protein